MYSFVEARWPLTEEEQDGARFLTQYRDVSLSKWQHGEEPNRIRSGAYDLFRGHFYYKLALRLGIHPGHYFFDISQDGKEVVGTSVERIMEVAG